MEGIVLIQMEPTKGAAILEKEGSCLVDWGGTRFLSSAFFPTSTGSEGTDFVSEDGLFRRQDQSQEIGHHVVLPGGFWDTWWTRHSHKAGLDLSI